MTIPLIILAACLLSAAAGYFLCYCQLADSTPPADTDWGTLPPPDEPIPYIISEFDSKA
jgi:hypothetical protein